MRCCTESCISDPNVQTLQQLHFEIFDVCHIPLTLPIETINVRTTDKCSNGSHFASDHKLKEAVYMWLAVSPNTLYLKLLKVFTFLDQVCWKAWRICSSICMWKLWIILFILISTSWLCFEITLLLCLNFVIDLSFHYLLLGLKTGFLYNVWCTVPS